MNLVSGVLLVFLLVGPVWAEKADRDKPMNIEADALRYDDLKQTSVFTGNAVITKGTIIIRGGKVEVRQDPEGYQTAVATGTADKRAFYRRKRDRVDEYIEGEGQTIEYDDKADTVKFVKQAVLRRYTGAKLSDETTGGVIVYNNQTDIFTVDVGAPGSPAVSSGGRVRALLAPRASAYEPGTAAPAARVEPRTTLRSSKTLKGEKQ